MSTTAFGHRRSRSRHATRALALVVTSAFCVGIASSSALASPAPSPTVGSARVVYPAVIGAVARPADETANGTLRTKTRVKQVAHAMLKESKWAGAGCVLNKSVSELLNDVKDDDSISVALAVAAAKEVNDQGSGFCGAVKVVAGTTADMWYTYDVHHVVYVAQDVHTTYYPIVHIVDHVTVTRWIGRDSKHVRKFAYTV